MHGSIWCVFIFNERKWNYFDSYEKCFCIKRNKLSFLLQSKIREKKWGNNTMPSPPLSLSLGTSCHSQAPSVWSTLLPSQHPHIGLSLVLLLWPSFCFPLDQVKGPSGLTLCSFSLHMVITDLAVSPTKPWLPGWLSGKESACKEMGLIPGLGKSSGGGHGNPFQYSCLESPMDRGGWWATVHGVAKSRTPLKQLNTAHFYLNSSVALVQSIILCCAIITTIHFQNFFIIPGGNCTH